MPGKSAQIEGLSSTPLTASRAPTKTRWRPVKANHRVSGLVQLVVYLTKHRIPTTVVVKQSRTAPKKSV
jgi:hypothetical protein